MHDEEKSQETTPTEMRDASEATRWVKGMPSPNPKGRPKMPKSVRDVRDLAREHTPMAIEVLARVANNPKSPPAARVTAAEALLARGWGRAPSGELEGAEALVIKVLRFSTPQIDDDGIKVIEGEVKNG
jgi:hypothetical protein